MKGSIVFYVDPSIDADPDDRDKAAIVTREHYDGTLNLAVFHNTRIDFLLDIPHDEAGAEGTWHYAPVE